MSPRLKLRSVATPLVMAGALWAGSTLTPVLGAGHGPIVNRGGPQTPPPCSPDGVCVPRPQTFGWYQTRWRTFPGDVGAKAPTEAELRAEQAQEQLGGPQLPTPTQEGQVGPAPTERPGAEGAPPAGGEDAAEAGLGTLPGEAPLGEFGVPGVAPAPGAGAESEPAEGAPAPGTDSAQPGAAPGNDPLDPFGNAPPKPPAWMTSAAANRGAQPQVLAPLPVVEHAAMVEAAPQPTAVSANLVLPAEQSAESIAAPAASAPPVLPPPAVIQVPASDGPNLHGDDAPPVLPPALAADAGLPARPAVIPASGVAAPKVQQPQSVQPVMIDDQVIIDDQVEAASAEQPMGIQLVNPAAAISDPNAQGLHQAIYFEASDQ